MKFKSSNEFKAKLGDEEEEESDWSESSSDETSTGDEIDYNQEDIWKKFLLKKGLVMN